MDGWLILENTLRERRVVIQGTEEQVALAKSLILEKVEEHRVLKSQLEDAQNQRTPRKNFKQQYLTSGDEAQVLFCSNIKLTCFKVNVEDK